MKKFLLLLASVFLIQHANSQNNQVYFNALNVALDQKAIAQDIVKSRVDISQNIDKDSSKQHINNSTNKFHQNISYLESLKLSRETHNLIEIEKMSFHLFKTLIMTQDKNFSVVKTIEFNDLFIKICDNLILSLFSKLDNQALSKIEKQQKNILNINFRINHIKYLTQKLNACYLLENQEFTKLANYIDTSEISTEIEENLNTLFVNDLNSLDIDDSISAMMSINKELKNNLRTNADSDDHQPILRNCEQIIKKANKTSSLYNKVIQSLTGSID